MLAYAAALEDRGAALVGLAVLQGAGAVGKQPIVVILAIVTVAVRVYLQRVASASEPATLPSRTEESGIHPGPDPRMASFAVV